MNAPRNKSEWTIVILLRVVGVSGLLAIPAIFFPYSWMNAVHDYMGLGTMPDTPIVSYLARSLSAFYAIVSAIMLLVSSDVRRYRAFVKLGAVVGVLMGLLLLGIGIASGLPTSWILGEGPPTAAAGLAMLWLERGITEG